MTTPTLPPIRVVVVDDDLFVRDHLAAFIEATPDMQLVATCASGAEAVTVAQSQPPDVILMDIQMPGMDGIHATRVIKDLVPAVRVVALTSFGDDDAVADMIDAGAAGFLLKSTKLATLMDAIRAAHGGLTVIPPETVLRWRSPRRGPTPPLLSERERQVLDLLATGLSNREIGQAMFLSPSTVKKHLRALMQEFGVTTRTGVVARAHELGLLSSRPD